MNELLILLMGAPPAGGEGSTGNPYSGIIMMVLILVVFWVFMIRPQMKKQKELKSYREGLKKGDKIITAGGIYGKVSDISGTVITVEVEDKMKLKIDKSAILKDNSDLAQK